LLSNAAQRMAISEKRKAVFAPITYHYSLLTF